MAIRDTHDMICGGYVGRGLEGAFLGVGELMLTCWFLILDNSDRYGRVYCNIKLLHLLTSWWRLVIQLRLDLVYT